MYTMEAKALAEEQKRLNPDCWKRKRTNSVKCPFLIDNSYRMDKISIYLSVILGFGSLNHNYKWPVHYSALSYYSAFVLVGFAAKLALKQEWERLTSPMPSNHL